MENNLNNVHVVIYSRRMLDIAIKRIQENGYSVDTNIVEDYYNDNHILFYADGKFTLGVGGPIDEENDEITLSALIELLISANVPKRFRIGRKQNKVIVDDFTFAHEVCHFHDKYKHLAPLVSEFLNKEVRHDRD